MAKLTLVGHSNGAPLPGNAGRIDSQANANLVVLPDSPLIVDFGLTRGGIHRARNGTVEAAEKLSPWLEICHGC
jgi:hypothetical protein